MKKVKFLAVIILLSAFGAMAQNPNRPNLDPKERASRIVGDLSKQITISPATQDSLKSSFVHFYDEMKKERESGNRPDMQKMEGDRDLKVKKFLTEDQFKVYQKFMEERKSHRNKPEGGGVPEIK